VKFKVDLFRRFKEIWLVNFEFSAPKGSIPKVRCLVAIEFISGRKIRMWEDETGKFSSPPYSVDPESLFVAYYSSAELCCHIALEWQFPCHILDLFIEFRNFTNGLHTRCGVGLVGALTHFGLSSINVIERESMRQLVLRGGDYSESEKTALLDYCESDVIALSLLLPMILPKIDMERALLRGRYMQASAQMEFNGIPIDTNFLYRLQEKWSLIQDALIYEINKEFNVFDGRIFKADRFEKWLIDKQVSWPLLANGGLDLKDDTFRQMARSYPAISPLRELRMSLSQMRLSALAVGEDGRNRCLLSAFSARTSRNQPSTSQFIFGSTVWLRGLIKPEEDKGIAYLDWSQQEFGIAAALSEDPLMKTAYLSGDPYLAFAKQAGGVPENATKLTHKAEREKFKACVLAVQYGMGAESLAQRIGQSVSHAKELLRLHKKTYHIFWDWSEDTVNYAMIHGEIWTVFGWKVHVDKNPNPRFLRNFLMQGNGAEMLRLACCMVSEAGIKLCAPVHDAILIEAPLSELDKVIKRTQSIMAEASAIILNGFNLNSDVEIVRYPDRYMDERGSAMWKAVNRIMSDLERSPCLLMTTLPVYEQTIPCSSMHRRPILLSDKES